VEGPLGAYVLGKKRNKNINKARRKYIWSINVKKKRQNNFPVIYLPSCKNSL